MNANAILIPQLIMARDVATLNASFKYTADLDNGNVITKGAISTDKNESQVYTAEVPATGGLTGLWMVFSPEDNIVTDSLGNQYKIGNLDPRAFTNIGGTVFSGFKPQVGDKILLSADGITGTVDAFVNAVDGAATLAFAADFSADALSFAVVETSFISVPSVNAIGSQRVTAYVLECVNN